MSSSLATGEPLILFAGRKRDIRLARMTANQTLYYTDSQFVQKSSQYMASSDYSIFGNFFVGIKSDSIYVSKTQLFAAPILESQANALNISAGIKTLMNMTEKTVAVDWIHNLMYYPVCSSSLSAGILKGIYVMNLTAPTQMVPIIPMNPQ